LYSGTIILKFHPVVLKVCILVLKVHTVVLKFAYVRSQGLSSGAECSYSLLNVCTMV
jgi:hypothetical protein